MVLVLAGDIRSLLGERQEAHTRGEVDQPEPADQFAADGGAVAEVDEEAKQDGRPDCDAGGEALLDQDGVAPALGAAAAGRGVVSHLADGAVRAPVTASER